MYYLSKEIGIPQRHSHLNKRHINVTINFQWDRNRLSISYAAPTIYFPSTRFAYKKKSVPESCWLQFADGTEPKDSPLRFSAIMCKCLVPVPTYGFFFYEKNRCFKTRPEYIAPASRPFARIMAGHCVGPRWMGSIY